MAGDRMSRCRRRPSPPGENVSFHIPPLDACQRTCLSATVTWEAVVPERLVWTSDGRLRGMVSMASYNGGPEEGK